MNNLPLSLKKIIFNKKINYNKELNCLPKNLKFLQLSGKYKLEIKNVPNGLNKVVCSKDCKFINNFVDMEVETYE